WRKKSFGSGSAAGCRYVERMLSVIQTLRLRGHAPLAYLAGAVEAYRKGEATRAIEPRRKVADCQVNKTMAGSSGVQAEMLKVACTVTLLGFARRAARDAAIVQRFSPRPLRPRGA